MLQRKAPQLGLYDETGWWNTRLLSWWPVPKENVHLSTGGLSSGQQHDLGDQTLVLVASAQNICLPEHGQEICCQSSSISWKMLFALLQLAKGDQSCL